MGAFNKPHVVCFPYPAQGHINPMLKLAKFLHFKGCHITFVHTDYNQRRLLNSRGSKALDGLPDFQFHAIPDGLPPSNGDSTQHVPSLCESISKNSVVPFRDLILRLNSSSLVPNVSCVIADGAATFTLDSVEDLGIPVVLFWSTSACGVLAYAQYRALVERGLVPLQDASCLTNGYLETSLSWIPAMKNIRLRDLPSFIRTTDKNDTMLNYQIREIERTSKARAVVINTFDSLEQDVLDALSKIFPPIYTIGPLNLLAEPLPPNHSSSNIDSSLWKAEPECIQWLDSKEPNSVLYVNFGSITVVTSQQMIEFAWGLANSKKNFLWIIRPDLVGGESSMLPPEFESETKGKGMLASWCAQEKVLKHPAVGGFLSHMGWNSTLESISAGVPMVCWPFFSEQQTNCWFACNKWGIGMEIDNNVKRGEVEKMVRELVDGEKGKEMKEKAMEWKRKAVEAISSCGSSCKNFCELVKLIQLNTKNY